jgi:hypothetical protein
MPIPDILALDFDGVLCDGMREYFETSRRTYAVTWSGEPMPDDTSLPAFRRLRPVIMSGWEMPLLLRALAEHRPEAAIGLHWERVRDELLESGPLRGNALATELGRELDDVRRRWIAADPKDWLGRHNSYCPLEELRRIVAEAERAILVTTKEGEFARLILDDWSVRLADIQGKESGTHKCDNLRALIADYAAARGRRPRLWFVEDRLETLQHVATHTDLDDVELFLAAWGYNTETTRETARADRRIHLLALERFRQGLAAWL